MACGARTQPQGRLPLYVTKGAQEANNAGTSVDVSSSSSSSVTHERPVSSDSSGKVHGPQATLPWLSSHSARLAKKNVTVSVTNVQNFHKLPEMAKPHSLLLTAFIRICTKAAGAPDFSGDKFTCAWNVVRGCVDHKARALAAVLTLHAEVPDGIRINSAVAAGEMLVGTLGNDEIRKVSVIGAHCVEAFTLERLGRWAFLPITVSGALRATVSESLARVYDYAECPSLYQGAPFEVCCLEGLRSQTDGVEWMYQLDKDSSNDPYRDWNTLCEAVFRRRWDVCTTFLLALVLSQLCLRVLISREGCGGGCLENRATTTGGRGAREERYLRQSEGEAKRSVREVRVCGEREEASRRCVLQQSKSKFL